MQTKKYRTNYDKKRSGSTVHSLITLTEHNGFLYQKALGEVDEYMHMPPWVSWTIEVY